MQIPQVNGAHSSGAVPNGSSVPLSPADHQEMDHRGRRMKSPLLPPSSPWRDIPPALPPKTHGEACSHSHQISKVSRDISLPPGSPSKSSLSPPFSSSPHSGSILPALVPPPSAISLHSQAMTPTSSITSHSAALHPSPPPSSPPFSLHFINSTSAASIADTAERTEVSKLTTSFEFSDSTSEHPYDSLVGSGTHEEDVPGVKSRHGHTSSSKSRSSQYSYTYVPTEEQRRLIKIKNSGRYEVTNEVEEVSKDSTQQTPFYPPPPSLHLFKVRGYDHLKFFKESETYWSPATTTSGLYAQLYENKYRELPREQIM